MTARDERHEGFVGQVSKIAPRAHRRVLPRGDGPRYHGAAMVTAGWFAAAARPVRPAESAVNRLSRRSRTSAVDTNDKENRHEEAHARRGRARGAAVAAALAAAVAGPEPKGGIASSHREAPLISEDPTADLTDLYAFRSPDSPNTVTILSNVIPAEDPAAGPNYYTFSPSARYNLKIDTNGDVTPDVMYRFSFRTKTGPFFLGDTAQPFTVTRASRAAARRSSPGHHAAEQHRAPLDPDYRGLAAKGVCP